MKDHSKLIAKVINDRFYSSIKKIGFDDMFQVGYIGLIKAEKKYDKSKGYQFSTYAYYCIKNEILTFLEKEQKRDVRPKYEDDNYVIESKAEFKNLYEFIKSKLNEEEKEYLKNYVFNNARYRKEMMSKIRKKIKKYEADITL